MNDHLFSAALALCLLAGEAAVLAHSMSPPRAHAGAQAQVIELPRVEVVGQRIRQLATGAGFDAATRAQ